MNMRPHFFIGLSIIASTLFTVGTAPTVLAANATIAGTITHDSDNTPVDSVVIYAERNDTGVVDSDTTDANGVFSISITDDGDGTDGSYYVYNWTSTSKELNVVFIRKATTVTLSDGENRTGVNLSLTRRARSQGYVYKSDVTTPIYGALVYWLRDTVWTDGYGTDYTTAGGFYSVAPTTYPNPTTSAIGTYKVQVTNPGYFGTEVKDIIFTADETTTAQNFTLTAASTVSGTITDTTGAPLAGVDLVLDDLNSYYTYLATTTSAGTYSISVFDQYDYDGTAVGNYTLTASADNYVTRSQNVSITADESALTGYDFTLRRAGRMTGVITTAAGASLADVTITVSDGLGNSYTATTDALGSFLLSNLRASENYTITISREGYVSTTLYDLSVTADETLTFDAPVALPAAVTLSGTVVTKTGGDPITGATMKLFNRSKPRSITQDYTLTTVSDGTFSSSQIAPGKYRVEVSQAGYVTLLEDALNLAESVAGKTYRLEDGATLSGRVTNNGKPVDQVFVTAYSKNPSTTGYSSDYTDSNGMYYMRSLEPGKYTIKVSSTGYTERVLTQPLRGGETTQLNIKIKEAGSVSGYITDAATGLPLASYLVRVRNQTVSAYSDANGYYIIDGLSPGRYKVYVYSSAYKTGRSKKVRVKANRVTQSVNFVLKLK